MTLWIILTVMIALTVCGLTIPLVRRYETQNAGDDVREIIRAQLGEVDAQEVDKTLSPEDAEALRGEIKRRLLVEVRQKQLPLRRIPTRASAWLAVSLVAIIALSATGLYAMLGRPDTSTAGSPVAAAQSTDAQHPMGDVASMIAGLEAKLQQAPDDAQGWQMLGWSYLQTGRPGDAAKAYGRAVALDPRNGEYISAQAEAMTQADGRVSDAAADLFKRALAIDAADPRSRYFLAMHRDQKGDRAGAMNDWIALIKSAPPGAPWVGEVRAYVEDKAREQGIDITSKLPALSSPAPSGAPVPGPTQEQIAAAGNMSDSDRQAMIEGMVNSLAGQLKASPRDSEGWIRLMRARMVLGQKDMAAAAYSDARKAFSDSPAELTTLGNAAKSLNIPGA